MYRGIIPITNLLSWFIITLCCQCYPYTENEEFYLGFVPDFGAPVTLLLLTNDAESVHYSVEAPVTGYHHNGSITRNGSLLTLPTSLIGISRFFSNAQNNAYKEGVYIKTSSKKVTIICGVCSCIRFHSNLLCIHSSIDNIYLTVSMIQASTEIAKHMVHAQLHTKQSHSGMSVHHSGT